MTLKDKALAFCARLKAHVSPLPEPARQLTRAEQVKMLLQRYPHRYVHDMRVRWWGHSMTATTDTRWAVWSTPRINSGDVVWTEEGAFIAHHVESCLDPADMVFASFVRIEDPELLEQLALPQHAKPLYLAGGMR